MSRGGSDVLVHIGYHKTGSTWLQQRLFADPGTGFAIARPREELLDHFVLVNPFSFSARRAAAHFVPAIEGVWSRGRVPVLSHERLSGNPHSGGYDSKSIADRLAETFARARILVVVREQVGMLVSVYKQYLKEGGSESLRQYLRAPSGSPRRPLFRYDYLEYHYLIDYYRRLLGDDRVLALPYELLRADPHDFACRIAKFTGAEMSDDVRTAPANEAEPTTALLMKRRLNRRLVRNPINPYTPIVTVPGLNEGLNRLSRGVALRLPQGLTSRLEEGLRRRAHEALAGGYAESNRRTAHIVGMDLACYGYDL